MNRILNCVLLLLTLSTPADGQEKTEALVDELLDRSAPPADFRPISKATRRAPARSPADRALALLASQKEELVSYLPVLPDTPEVHDRVKALLDSGAGQLDAASRERLRGWLMLHSRYFRRASRG